MLSHRWQQWKEHVLLRPVPHTLVSWRFLLPFQSRAIQLHRRVFLGAWPRLPRWQWALIALYSSMTWLLFHSWQQIYFCMKNRSRDVAAEYCVPVHKQLVDLLYIALLHGIPPDDFYDYGLFNRPRKQWLEYIYPHELPQWHQVLSAGMRQKTLHLMTDKRAFAEHMNEKGIASVETCAFFARGEAVKADSIFSGRSLFFKPNTGSRGEGCFALSFDSETGQYQISDDEKVLAEEDILAEINRRIELQDYLVQPLLKNHRLVDDLYGASKLVNLRLVTGIIRGKPDALFASLLIPCVDEYNTYWWLDIDVSSGLLLRRANVEPDELQVLMQRLGGRASPFWREAVDICLKAHSLFPDLPSIGWDVAITSSGVKLLEGNFWWGVDGHQELNGPALHTALVDVYQQGVSSGCCR